MAKNKKKKIKTKENDTNKIKKAGENAINYFCGLDCQTAASDAVINNIPVRDWRAGAGLLVEQGLWLPQNGASDHELQLDPSQ